MTLSEFKAWFEGFTEDMAGPPSAKQWKKIQARVSEITGEPLTQHHFYHRYWNPYFWSSFGLSQGVGALNSAEPFNLTNQGWNSASAMQLLGKADALVDAA
jgi:hypothetical protein